MSVKPGDVFEMISRNASSRELYIVIEESDKSRKDRRAWRMFCLENPHATGIWEHEETLIDTNYYRKLA